MAHVVYKNSVEAIKAIIAARKEAGNAYNAAWEAIKAHEGDCERCVWFGDACVEREARINAMLKARAEWAAVKGRVR